MDERIYPAIGTATISVEKYEDLIRTAETEKRNAEVNKEKYWVLFDTVTKLEKKIEAQTEAVKSAVETVATLSDLVSSCRRAMADLKVYTLEEVCDILKVTKRTVYSYIKADKLHAVKMGKYWRVSEENLKAFIETGTPVLNENRRKENQTEE